MELGLRERIAIVAGASQGLGKATAKALAAEGARVVICSRNAAALEAAASEIRQDVSGTVLAVRCDVTQSGDVTSLVRTVSEKWGPAEILVSNAGGPPTGLFEDLSIDRWRSAIELNLLSTVGLCQAIVPDMRKRKWGRIVHIASIAAKQPIPGLMLSNAARAGVLGFAKTLADELAGDMITVNSVCPGYTRTERLVELAKSNADRESVTEEEVYRRWEETIPMKRLGRPEELGALIAFLCSNQAGYITGCAIQVDGGYIRSIF